jgi:hypothetical protein
MRDLCLPAYRTENILWTTCELEHAHDAVRRPDRPHGPVRVPDRESLPAHHHDAAREPGRDPLLVLERERRRLHALLHVPERVDGPEHAGAVVLITCTGPGPG